MAEESNAEKGREERHFDIVVNGRPHRWPKDAITYVEVVTLAYPDYRPGDGTNYSVKYSKGPKENREGVLVPGAAVKVKGGMVFHVKRTGQS